MKNICKFVGLFVAVMFYVFILQETKVEAAYTSDGVYYPDLLTEVDLGEFESQVLEYCNSYPYFAVAQNIDNPRYYKIFFFSETDSKVFGYGYPEIPFMTMYCSALVDVSSLRAISAYPFNQMNIRNPLSTNATDIALVGTNFEIGYSSEAKDSSFYTSFVDSLPQNNLVHPLSVPEVISSVNINVNGIDYTVSEPYPYYLAFKKPGGSITLLFSDIPFTGCMLDLYVKSFSVSSDAEVVSYSWDSVTQNDFLSSRTVSTGFGSIRVNTDIDYLCNYLIHNTNSLLDVFLPEKERFTILEKGYSASELYSALPAELSAYNNCIIFSQESEFAYDNSIIFYGWDDDYAHLYILSKNSQMVAYNAKGQVSKSVTAYYDVTLEKWFISDSVVLGATRNRSYCVPYIFYSNVDLLLCDEFGVWNGEIVYLCDEVRPSTGDFSDDDDSLVGRIINGFKRLFVNLFVPSNGYFTRKFNEVSSYFAFWKSIRDTVTVFIDFLKETDFTEPPKVQIDLSAIKSKVSYGGKVYVLDFSWYEPYKESVDVILSSILWLVFCWNTYKNLPNIISGIAGGVHATASITEERKE